MAETSGGGNTRKALAEQLGVSESTLFRWQASTEHAFPSPGQDGTWELQPVLDWYEHHRAAKKSRMTQLDRSGDPNDLVDVAEAARILGYRGKNPAATITSYRSPRHGDYFPAPDVEDGSGPLWRRESILAFGDRRERHGGGRPGRSGRKVRPDPRLPVVRTMLAQNPQITGPMIAVALKINERKAYRLLKAAKASSDGDAGNALPAGHES